MKSLTIIVPALNEEKNLEAAITTITRCFSRLGFQHEILLFNDHSDDGTGALADSLALRYKNLQVFHNPRRMNIGGIYRAGIERAQYEYCLLLPGDNGVMVDDVASGLRYLDQADLVITFTENQGIRPFLRRVLSCSYTRLVNLLFGVDFSYTNGSNTCRTDLLRKLCLTSDGFSYQTEVLVKLVRLGVDFIEYGINIRERAHGRSSALAVYNWLEVARALAVMYWDIRVVNRAQYTKVGKKLVRASRSKGTTVLGPVG